MLPKISVDPEEIIDERSEEPDLLDESFVLIEEATAAARSATKGVSKGDIKELKSFANPPVLVKTTLEAVLTLQGRGTKDWKQVKKVIGDPKFLSSMANFDTRNITMETLQALEVYTNDPNFTSENVMKVTRACASLVEWVHDQVRYAKLMMEERGELEGQEQ